MDFSNEKLNRWNSICSEGKKQSPINFAGNYSLYNTDQYIKIIEKKYNEKLSSILYIDNLEEFVGDFDINTSGYIIINKNGFKIKYFLTRVMFKKSSEHTINNIYGDIEIQLLHENEKINKVTPSEGDYLIISIILKQSLIESIEIKNFISFNTLSINNWNISNLVQNNKPFFFYEGSLTNTKCTENVSWLVYQEIQYIEQIFLSDLTKWIDSVFSGNSINRKVKDIGLRKVYYQYYENEL